MLGPPRTHEREQYEMATEFRQRLRDESDPPPARGRGGRLSIRPSAFGIPRASGRPSDEPQITDEDDAASSSQAADARVAAPPAAPDEPAHVPISQMRRRQVPERVVKTNIEDLLPISQGVKSLPRPPRVPTFEAPSVPPPTTRRFPWMSLSIFGVVFVAGLATVARYRVERTSTAEADAAGRRGQHEIDWNSLTPVAHRFEHGPWAEPPLLRDALLDEGERALAAEHAVAAERAFSRALAFGTDDPSAAFGLARARLAQGDLQGARGWAETALQRRPLDGRYHTFFNKVSGQAARPGRTR